MAAVAFDTLKLARALRTDAQMSAEQAEGISNALAEAMSGAELATKADLRELELRLDARFAAMDVKIEAVRADLLRWMFGALAAQTALIAALLKLIH